MADSSEGRNPLEVLAEEFLERHRRGERPALSEYTRCHPEIADDIRGLFPALLVMEDVRPPEDESESQPSATIRDLEQPTRLGDFRIIREVGRGGMGVVYEAEQVTLGRRVALKVLPKQVLLDSKHAKRFEREARAAAKLHHTNIVPVFGVGQQDGLHYYVMQFIHGLGLDEVLVELQRLRNESQASGGRKPTDSVPVGVQASACPEISPKQREGWTPTHNDVSAAAVANSLLSGHFERTVVVDSDSGGTDSPSSSSVDPRPSTLDPTTAVGRLSDTFALPGHSEHTSKHHSRSVYWQSVTRIGVQAAEALQYAHDQGIIHRDVKPGNLLLDTRGSVWVTDFGLAKAADQQDLTHTGDVLGTLRYMAPEQFEGQADARSDVFSLGLTLYELLALKPAFDETDRHRLVKRVTTGTPARLRTLDSHIPRDLETIVHKAIDRDPSHRYETAGELAADLQRYLGDEPIRARWISPATRFTRWCRRNPAVAALTCTVAVLMIGAGALLVRASQNRARATAQVELILEDVDRLESEQHWSEALAAAERAAAVMEGAEPDHATKSRLRRALDELTLVQRLDAARQSESRISGGTFDRAGAVQAYASAFSDFGLELEEVTVEHAAEQLRFRPEISVEVATALAGWAWLQRILSHGEVHDESHWQHLLAVADAIDSDDWRCRLRAAWKAPDVQSQTLRELAGSADVTTLPAASVVLLAQLLNERASPDEAATLLLEARQYRPEDFWINFELAHFLAESTPKRLDDAITCLQVALALRPGNPAVLNELGVDLKDKKQYDRALACYRTALERHPDLALLHINLGVALQDQGNLNDAIAEFRTAIRLAPRWAVPHDSLGSAWQKQGDLDAAIAEYRVAIALDDKYANPHSNLGSALEKQGDIAGAMAEYREAIRLDAKHVLAHNNLGHLLFGHGRIDEARVEFQTAIALDPDYAEAHSNLGALLHLRGESEAALAELRRAINLNPDFAPAHNNLGHVLLDLGQLDEATEQYRVATDLDPTVAEPHLNLGTALVDRGELEAAIDEYHKAMQLNPDDPAAWYNLGIVLRMQGNLDQAIDAYLQAIEFAPNMAAARYALGIALEQQNRLEEAMSEYRAAIEHDASLAEAHNNLGNLLRILGRLEEALEEFRAALAINPRLVEAQWNLGLTLHDQQKLPEAITAYHRAIEIAPDSTSVWNSLGAALYEQGDRDGAIDALRTEFEVSLRVHGPRNPSTQKVRTNLAGLATNWSWTLATAVDESERDPNKAVVLARLAADLIPEDANHWNNLGVAHYRRGDFQSAIDALQRADTLLNGGDRPHRMFLAMAHWRVGRDEAARRFYAQGAAWIAAQAQQDEEQQRFRAEAEALMGIDTDKRAALISEYTTSGGQGSPDAK